MLGCEVLRSWAKESGIRACGKLSSRKPSSDSSSCTGFVQWPPIAVSVGVQSGWECSLAWEAFPFCQGTQRKGMEGK